MKDLGCRVPALIRFILLCQGGLFSGVSEEIKMRNRRKSHTLLAWMGRQVPVVINPRMFTNFFFSVNQEWGFAAVAIKEEWKQSNPFLPTESERTGARY